MQGCPFLCLSSLEDPRFKKVYMAPAIAASTISDLGNEFGSRSPTSQAKSCEVEDEDNGNSLWSCHDRTQVQYELTIEAPSMRD